MRRRDFLATSGLAALGLSSFPMQWVPAADGKKQKVLYFTLSQGFVHSVVKRTDGELAYSEKVLMEMGQRYDVEVVCSQDGSVFDGDLDQYDAIAFYTSGTLTEPNKLNQPPMSPRGKKRLFDYVASGKGFVGFHAATDSFRSGEAFKIQEEPDPYIRMIGGEFVSHGPQQEATVTATSPKFPGLKNVDGSLRLMEEWYALKNFPDDLHVILLQETKGMKSGNRGDYDRPPFPATWARRHGDGRVFYTSFGHREDIWTNPTVQQIMLGGFAWAMGNAEADVTPNISKVAPKANQLTM